MDDNKIPVDVTPQNDIPNGLLKLAIDEYGLAPIICVGFCIIVGAGAGGLIGYKMFIEK